MRGVHASVKLRRGSSRHGSGGGARRPPGATRVDRPPDREQTSPAIGRKGGGERRRRPLDQHWATRYRLHPPRVRHGFTIKSMRAGLGYLLMMWAPNPILNPPIHTRMGAAGPSNSGQPCQWPSGDHGTGAMAVPMEIMESPGKCSAHGNRGVPRRVQYPW